MALQAALQHVVLTYDPVNGRQIYVNGVNQNIPDPQKGGTISNWDSTFALVLGSEVSGDNAFQGEIKFLAIHQRALSAAQVLQNFNAGVGPALLPAVQRLQRAGRQRAAGVHHVHGEPVRQLQLSVLPADVHLARSDREADAASRSRACASASTARSRWWARPTSRSIRPSRRAGLHRAGRGAVDRRHGDRTRERAAHRPVLPAVRSAGNADGRDRRGLAVPGERTLRAGARARPHGRCRCAHLCAGELDLLRSSRACRPRNAAVVATYQSVQQQLPAVNTLEAYSSANQVGVAQLAVQYCNQMMSRPRRCRPRCSRA